MSAPSDRRRLEISLTPEGEATARSAIEVARKVSARTQRNLTAREAKRLRDLLDKL